LRGRRAPENATLPLLVALLLPHLLYWRMIWNRWDGPEAMEQASVFREYMAGLQYRSGKPICVTQEINRLLAQQKSR
jgi:hypothetical protein